MSSIDLRNWDDYYFSFNQAFTYLDADWTDPKRFPKGKKTLSFSSDNINTALRLCQSKKNICVCLIFKLLISLDDRDNNGFWVPYKCHSVWGHFLCPVEDYCSWQSRDVQVDLLVRVAFCCSNKENFCCLGEV